MNNTNNTTERATLKAPELVTCWKCLGDRKLEAFRHVANGVCFACGGTGKAEIRTWTRGVAKNHGEITFEYGGGRGWGLITNGGRAEWAGVLVKPRPHKLALIRSSLDAIKAGDESAIFEAAVLLASLEDAERASARAVAFLGDKGDKLAAALAGGVAVVKLARELAAAANFAPPEPYQMPANAYGVGNVGDEGGLCGKDLTWEEACELVDALTEEHGGTYEVLKFDARELAWFTRSRAKRFL